MGTIIIFIIFISSNISYKKVKIEITLGEQDNKAEITALNLAHLK